MSDFRRGNFIPLTADRMRLDFFNASYTDIKFALAPERHFVVTEGWEANLPGLADHLYGDINFWWILAQYNGIVDPITELKAGLVLGVPSKEDIITFLNVKNNSTTERVVEI